MNSSYHPFKFAAWGLVFLALVGLLVPYAVSARSLHILEDVIERCSTTVHIVPAYTEEPGNINPPGAIVLHRTSPNALTAWSSVMFLTYMPDGNIRWYCGTTDEESGCPDDTVAVKARLGPSRLLEILCLG